MNKNNDFIVHKLSIPKPQNICQTLFTVCAK